MSHQITILAIVDKDDKWDEMKAKYDGMSLSDVYTLSDETDEIFDYFCHREPRTDGKMYMMIEHTERHDDATSESFYAFSIGGEDFVIVETP